MGSPKEKTSGKSRPALSTEPCQLYLICDFASGGPAPDAVAAVIEAGDVVSLRLDLPADQVPDLERLARITSIAQAQGVAVLVRDQIELVAKLGLDGVHLSASEHITADVARARAALGRDSIVGASAGLSRHLAMSLAELGADYVGVDLDKDDSGAQSRLLEFVAWWGEIIEVPCVAFGVETPEFAQSLAANGADFIAMTLLAGTGAEAAGVSARTFDTAIKGPVTKDT